MPTSSRSTSEVLSYDQQLEQMMQHRQLPSTPKFHTNEPEQKPRNAGGRKPILYYSNHCEGSRMVINVMLKNDVRSHFACVCVDSKPDLVPSFVTSVPCVFLLDSQQLLRGVQITEYLEGIIAARQQAFDQVMPVHGNSAMAQSFSWVDDDKQTQENVHASSRYVPVDFQSHAFQQIEESTPSRNGNEMDAAYAKLKSEREQEAARLAAIPR